MNPHDRNIAAFKEILTLFALLTFVGALYAGRYLAAVICLSVALLLFYEEPISRWRRRFFGW